MEAIAHEAVELGYADWTAQGTRFGSGAANRPTIERVRPL